MGYKTQGFDSGKEGGVRLAEKKVVVYTTPT